MPSSRRSKNPTARETLAPGSFGAPNVRLLRKIAEGGMGSVWEGEHLGLKTNVAVKFVLGELGDNEEALTRFGREATATARIKSPHVVQVFDHGKNEEGFPYMVMEFLEGEDLEARLERDKKLPAALVFQIILQAAKALAKAHDLGIVHRDMKPSNVFLTDLEGEVFVKILDFGIAKMSNDDLRMSMTQTGAVIGTPYFMAPEQMTSAKDAGPASDVWSLGVIAYRALTGRLPYESDTLAGLAMAIERGSFPPASTLVEGLPPGVDEWFKRAIAKDPADRFATIREAAEDLGKIVRTQMGHQVYTSSSPPPSLRAPSEKKPTAPPSEASPASARPLSEATTLAVTHGPNRPLTEMSSTKALAARQSRGSSLRLVIVGAVATIIGSLGAYLYVSAQRNQAAAEASASSVKPEKSSVPKPAKSAAPEVPTSEPTPAASAEPSAEPVGSAEDPDASSSAVPSASAPAAPPSPPKGQLPKPPQPKPSASAGAAPAPSAKPSASAAPAPSPKPSASAPPAPKPSAPAPAKPAPSAAK
ncbi:MAG: serine/threonine protein kinase [Myxococcales bacterium]|nr:serine/threonine protein kinase [Myxococcales bacterium]